MLNQTQLIRIFEIDRQIRAGLYPRAEDISVRLQCSRRTIFLAKRFMTEHLAAPIEFDRPNGGWCYTDPAWRLPGIVITRPSHLPFLGAGQAWIVFTLDQAGRMTGASLPPAHSADHRPGAVQTVAIHFAATEAAWLRAWPWPDGYQWQERADGGAILQFETGSLGAVSRWLLSFGARARVLKPAGLQAELAAAHRRAWAQYAGDGPAAANGLRPGPRPGSGLLQGPRIIDHRLKMLI